MSTNPTLLQRLRASSPLVTRSSRDRLREDYETLERQLNGIGVEGSTVAPFLTFAPPGHFYSPIPPLDEAVEHARRVRADLPDSLPGIDGRLEAQLELAAQLVPLREDFSPPADAESGRRYFSDNPAFGMGDARLLQAMLRHLQPKRVIEIGSGYSSAVMLDVVDEHLSGHVEITFIEPYQDLLRSLLRPDDLDRVELVSEPVQQVDLRRFDALESGDVLFVDSTHVVRAGSDVTHEVFEILPRLRAGVVVHFHDMFFPFDYPEGWIREGRVWTEAYLLRAFLMHNDAYEIMLWPHQLHLTALDRLTEVWPMGVEGPGSLWLRKTR